MCYRDQNINAAFDQYAGTLKSARLWKRTAEIMYEMGLTIRDLKEWTIGNWQTPIYDETWHVWILAFQRDRAKTENERSHDAPRPPHPAR